MPSNSQFSGGAPCFLYIICNNITLKSAKRTFYVSRLPYIIKSCNRLKISILYIYINS